jgi:prepilin-type N-terminal cleavage/methylation domain-containing protein/prepilin-type processing-associated H-X9-DG protein
MERAFVRHPVSRGFTLIELLVVIAIIAVLIALLLPAVQAAREAARRAQCTNNMKQLGLAVHNYVDVNLSFPSQIAGYAPGGGVCQWFGNSDYRTSWIVEILPQIEQTPLFNAYNFTGDRAEYSFNNVTVIATPLNAVMCPSYPGPMIQQGQSDWNSYAGTETAAMATWYIAGTCYKGSMGDNTTGVWPGSAATLGDCVNNQPTATGMFWRAQMLVTPQMVTDGFSNTLLDGEAMPNMCQWNAWSESNSSVATTSIPMNQMTNLSTGAWNYCFGFRSQHPGGINAGFCDGSVRFLKLTVNQNIYRALSTRAMGEVISSDAY